MLMNVHKIHDNMKIENLHIQTPVINPSSPVTRTCWNYFFFNDGLYEHRYSSDRNPLRDKLAFATCVDIYSPYFMTSLNY
jgi:hypothetical protein